LILDQLVHFARNNHINLLIIKKPWLLPWLNKKKAMGYAPMAFAFSKQNATWVHVPKVKVIKIKEKKVFVHGE